MNYENAVINGAIPSVRNGNYKNKLIWPTEVIIEIMIYSFGKNKTKRILELVKNKVG